MPSYDLYSSLGLDRGRTTEQLAAELDQRLAGTSRGAPQRQELTDARAVLGDPTRRSMYDQRLDDATQTVTPAEIQQLAAMNVGAASSGSTGGGLTGVIKQNPKLSATVGVLAVAVLVVGGLAIGGAVGGGDDDDASATSASATSGSGSSDYDDSDSREVIIAKGKFEHTKFLGDGDKITVRSSSTDSGVYDSYEYAYTNLRTMPKDGHTYGCWDIVGTSLVGPSDTDTGEYRAIVDTREWEQHDPGTIPHGAVDEAFAFNAATMLDNELTGDRAKSIYQDKYFTDDVINEFPELLALTDAATQETRSSGGYKAMEGMVKTDGLDFTMTECVGIADGIEAAPDNLSGIAAPVARPDGKDSTNTDAEYIKLNF